MSAHDENDRDLHELLCAYLLGEASAEERAKIEEALAASEELRAERERLEATIGVVQGAFPGEKLAGDASDRILAAATPQAPVARRAWYATSAFRMAASFAVLTLGYAAFRYASTERSVAPEDGMAKLDARDDATAAYEPRQSQADDVARGGLRPVEQQESAAVARERSAMTSSPASEPAAEAARRLREVTTRTENVRETPVEKAQDTLGRALEVTKDSGDAGRQVELDGELFAKLADQAPPGEAAPDASRPDLSVELNEQLSSARVQLEEGKRKEAEVHTIVPDNQWAGAGNVDTYRGPGDSVPVAGAGAAGAPSGPSSPGPGRSAYTVTGLGGGGGQPAPGSETGSVELRYRAAGKKIEAPSAATRGGSDEFFLGLAERRAQDVQGVDFERADELGADRLRRMQNADPCEIRGHYVNLRLTPDERRKLVEEECKRLLGCCRPYPHETPSMMFFRFWGDNPFEMTALDKLSTFSVDVDTASYALARRYLKDGHLPTKAQIRTEEFVNYFRPDLAAPVESDFAIYTELAPSRFGGPSGRWMLRVGLRGREVSREERKPLALTFVVDTSGSMKKENRLELVKHALRLLIAEMDANDRIAIVAFSNEARLVLPATSAGNRGLIEAAIYGLNANGGTNAEAGLMMGYELALKDLAANVSNRVVLLSDGVANIGQTDQDRIAEKVKGQRDKGIYLNTVGVGMGNHNDVFLEQLADKGDGICNYVDSEKEARRALVDNFTGAFEPIARDVKIQVEFDPKVVYRYRLLGYENRAIADADFRNDTVDAGEVGAGHQVVALYELELSSQASVESGGGNLGTVRVRWLPPTGRDAELLKEGEGGAQELEHPFAFSSATSFEGASAGYHRSVYAAQFAEILRRSQHARDDSLDELIAESVRLAPQLADPDFTELVELMQRSRDLVLARLPYDDLARTLDAVRYNHYLHAQFERLKLDANDARVRDLEEKNRELEDLIRDLVRKQIDEESNG